MFSRILFATDLSPASDLVIDCLAGWKAAGLAHVTVANVHAVHYVAGAAGMEVSIRETNEPKLERQVQRLRDAGIEASWKLEFGVPYWEIERVARSERAELVVLGSHGSSWIKEVWLGSVADAILRHVQLPVLVIKVNHLAELPAEKCTELCDSLFGRALIATDFSPDSEAAVAFARKLALRGRGDIRLLHVQERSRIFPHLASRLDEFNREDARRLDLLAGELRAAGAREVSIEVRTDHAVPGIVASTEEWKPRLVVLGRYGRSRGGRRLIGSTAHDVARESPAPVLVLPREP